MTGTELIAVTALTASAITALASLGMAWVGHRLRVKEAVRDRKRAGYLNLITASAAFIDWTMTATSIQADIRRRHGSGGPSLDPTNVSELLSLYEWGARDYAPLRLAVGQIWLDGSPAVVALAIQLGEQCQKVNHLLRQTETPKEPELQAVEAIRELGRIRVEFNEAARIDLNQPAFPLRTLDGPNDSGASHNEPDILYPA